MANVWRDGWARRIRWLGVLLALAGCAGMPNSPPSPAEPPPPPPSNEATGSSSPAGAEAPASQAEQSGQSESSETASGSAEAEASGSQGEAEAQAQAKAKAKSNETGAESNDAGGTGAEAAEAEVGAADAQPPGGASGGASPSASASAGDQAPSGGQPGEVPGAGSIPPAGTGQGGGAQGDEALARLEAELEGSLQSFDQTLLEDRAALQTKVETGESRSGSGATETAGGRMGGGWAPPEGNDPNGIDGGYGGEQSQAGEGDQSIQSTGADGGLATTQRADGKTTRPPNIPPGDDDDIVARQLREAAERETDPELREKLWEEYRAYKFNQSRGGDGAGT